ncbi:MAG: hypothetical protein GF329_06735 [Candidatus Lokiarchaeota archaeon]|nr:hypothetical protein [Candidatus Lokiarchaeota archaeon]
MKNNYNLNFKKWLYITLLQLLIFTMIFVVFYLKTISINHSINEMSSINQHPNKIQVLEGDAPYIEEWNLTQQWVNDVEVWDIAIDRDNNIYLTGRSDMSGSPDATLTKYDSEGNQLWNRSWGGSDFDRGRGVAVDNNNNIYVTGETESFGSGSDDAFLVKYDSSGNKKWQQTWGDSHNQRADGVAVDNNNNVYITGYDYNYDPDISSGWDDIFLVKYNSAGNKKWSRNWGGVHMDGSWEYANDIAIDSNNNIYISGQTIPPIENSDGFLVKYNSAGNKIWERIWDKSEVNGFSGLAINENNKIYVAGYTSSSSKLFKYDSSGNKKWHKNWEGSDDISINSENFIYTCAVNDATDNLFIFEYDSGGGKRWEQIFNIWYDFGCRGIVIDTRDNIYIAGTRYSRHKGVLLKFGLDSDNDGIPNDLDIDDDNDGLLDVEENNIYNTDPLIYDTYIRTTKLNLTKSIVAGEECTLKLNLTNGLNGAINVNISLFESKNRFYEKKCENITLISGNNSLEINLTSKESAEIENCIIGINISRKGILLISNNSNITLLPAYILGNITTDKFTIQGENCSILLEIYNNRTVSIPIDIDLYGIGFDPVNYSNIILEKGLNTISVNITAKEFSNIGDKSININISRNGYCLFTLDNQTTIIKSFYFQNLSYPEIIEQDQLFCLSLNITNNRSSSITFSIRLRGQGVNPVEFNYTIQANMCEDILVPMQFHPENIYDTDRKEFTLDILYKDQVVYSYSDNITLEINSINFFIGFILPIIIIVGIISAGAVTIYSKYKQRINRKVNNIGKKYDLQELPRKNPLRVLKEKIKIKVEELNTIDLGKYNTKKFRKGINLIYHIREYLSDIEFYVSHSKLNIENSQWNSFIDNQRTVLKSIENAITKKIREEKERKRLSHLWNL